MKKRRETRYIPTHFNTLKMCLQGCTPALNTPEKGNGIGVSWESTGLG